MDMEVVSTYTVSSVDVQGISILSTRLRREDSSTEVETHIWRVRLVYSRGESSKEGETRLRRLIINLKCKKLDLSIIN